jgi:hypothetical protein
MLTSAREDVFQEATRRATSLERCMSQAGRCGGMGGTVGWGVAETFFAAPSASLPGFRSCDSGCTDDGAE